MTCQNELFRCILQAAALPNGLLQLVDNKQLLSSSIQPEDVERNIVCSIQHLKLQDFIKISDSTWFTGPLYSSLCGRLMMCSPKRACHANWLEW